MNHTIQVILRGLNSQRKRPCFRDNCKLRFNIKSIHYWKGLNSIGECSDSNNECWNQWNIGAHASTSSVTKPIKRSGDGAAFELTLKWNWCDVVFAYWPHWWTGMLVVSSFKWNKSG